MRRLLVAALLLAATPAAAQRLECMGIEGGRQVCTPSRADLFDNLARQAEPRAAAQGSQSAGPPAPFVTPQQRRLVQAVARAVMAGHCDKARERAIAAGDLDLAGAAVVQCQARLAQQGQQNAAPR